MEPVIIGNATLYLGDCLQVMAGLPDNAFDALVTDPPYGIGESSRKVASRGKMVAPTNYGEFNWDEAPLNAAAIAAMLRIAKTQVIFGGNYFPLPPSPCWLVWDKMNSGDFADCELAWTNIKGAVRIIRHMWNGMLRDSERGTPRVHPTQKPIPVMAFAIDKCKLPAGSTVFDPYMGSGTTGIAAVQLGYAFVGCEREPQYFETACRRIEAAQAQQRLFE
jgi:site-specific DNA-methyltransferase (adenine-specific)/modification methylase